MKEKRKIAIIAVIVALVALALIIVLFAQRESSQQDPEPTSNVGQHEPEQSAIPTVPSESTKPEESSKPVEETAEPGHEIESPEPVETDHGDKDTQQGKPGISNTQKPIKKTAPISGIDYTVPTELKGTVGNKLSTVSLGNSHLVWVNPDEELFMNKTQYEAKFVETDTKEELVVKVTVEVVKGIPIKGIDYTIPTELKGTVDKKLSTVSLGDSNLVWVNPDEELSMNKTQYEAKFVETDTKEELVVKVTVKVVKGIPVKGTDYTIPTGLMGIVGNKLSTVSLGDSHLVWVNPDEELSMNKTQYEAKFVETDTRTEKIVVVTIQVMWTGGGDMSDPGTDGSGDGSTDGDDDEGSSSDDTQQGGGPTGGDVSNPGTDGSGDGSTDGDDDEGSSSDDTQQGGGPTGGDVSNPGTDGSGDGSTDDSDDEGSSSDDTQQGGGPAGGDVSNPGTDGSGDGIASDDDEGSSFDDTQQGGGPAGGDVSNPGTDESGDGIASDDDEGSSFDDTQQGGGPGGGNMNNPGV